LPPVTSKARAEEGGETLDEAGAQAEGSLDRARGKAP
jgi:hypothetical protein